jgi:cob(I)alamin adenosyltransferase
MSKLYTKTGDCGFTNLYDMRRLYKDDLHFEVLGDLDELSANVGLVCVYLDNHPNGIVILRKIQSQLLDIGSDIATTKNRDKIVKITEADVKKIEIYIDEFSEKTPKLTEFILPGYKHLDAHLHICRTICRRAERHMWALFKKEPDIATDKNTFIYINRLSDFFFAMARLFTNGKEITRSSANS